MMMTRITTLCLVAILTTSHMHWCVCDGFVTPAADTTTSRRHFSATTNNPLPHVTATAAKREARDRPIRGGRVLQSTQNNNSGPEASSQEQGEEPPQQQQAKQQQVEQQKDSNANTSNNKNSGNQKKKASRGGNNNKNNNKKNDKTDADFRWLYWLFKQWHPKQVGTVEKSVLQQFLPAAQSWKSKRTIEGAERATALVERYSVEYLAGHNPHAIIKGIISSGVNAVNGNGNQQQQPPPSQSYYDKLLRTGWEAWLQLPETELCEADATIKATKVLDHLMAMTDRSIRNHNHKNRDQHTLQAKKVQQHLNQHRMELQRKIAERSAIKQLAADKQQGALSNTNTNNNNNNNKPHVSAADELPGLLVAAMDLQADAGGTSRQHKLEDSLVAMQKTVALLDRHLGSSQQQQQGNSNGNGNNNKNNDYNTNHERKQRELQDLIDTYERELVFTLTEQEQLVKSSEWLSVALPFWEFLHHSLIRALIYSNQSERAQGALDLMQGTLKRCIPGKQPSTTLDQILALEGEGTDLLQLIHKDKEFQWLQWLSHQIGATPVGELSESVLNLMIPAVSNHACRKTDRDATQAEKLLQRYIQECQAGNPDAILTNSLFNRVCDAWAKLGKPEQAQHVLNQMLQLRTQYPDNPNLTTDVISLSTLAAAWAKSRDPQAAKKAEAILQHMEVEGLKPTTITYNTVLSALIRSPQLNKAMRAEEIVQRMEQRYKTGDHRECQPSIRTYQSLIAAWSRTDLAGTPQKAEQVLETLDQKAAKEGRKDLEPNTHCFAAAIHAWAYSLEEQKARRAYNILTHMRDRYEKKGKKHCEPNVVVYTSVINACASPAQESEKEESFQIAELTMNELYYNRKYGFPNFLTYSAFLRVCATTLEPGSDRDDVVQSMFTKCCEAGQVGDVVLAKLKLAASEELYQTLVGEYETGQRSWSLPRSWTRRLQGTASERQPHKKTKTSRKYKPEAARLQEVRLLSGTTGRFSKSKDDDSIMFKQESF